MSHTYIQPDMKLNFIQLYMRYMVGTDGRRYLSKKNSTRFMSCVVKLAFFSSSSSPSRRSQASICTRDTWDFYRHFRFLSLSLPQSQFRWSFALTIHVCHHTLTRDKWSDNVNSISVYLFTTQVNSIIVWTLPSCKDFFLSLCPSGLQ